MYSLVYDVETAGISINKELASYYEKYDEARPPNALRLVLSSDECEFFDRCNTAKGYTWLNDIFRKLALVAVPPNEYLFCGHSVVPEFNDGKICFVIQVYFVEKKIENGA